jgi:ubiquitin-protein ligase
MPTGAIRLRRLQADHESMIRLSEDSDLIRFQSFGQPPDRYVVTFGCRGVVKADDRISYTTRHQIEILLHAEYPQAAPHFRQLTPIFHPNFRYGTAGLQVCIEARNWSPRESLSDLVLRLGNMITYRNYNPDSPLDGEAAQWARQNAHLFPLDERGWFRDAGEIVKLAGEPSSDDVGITIVSSDGIGEPDIEII